MFSFQLGSIFPAVQLDLPCLTHLSLVFHCEAWSAGDLEHPILQDGMLTDLRPASFQFTAVASAIVDEIPSLEYCVLTIGAEVTKHCPHLLVERWCETRAWRIARHEDDGTCRRELVELHKNVAETIIAKEDLGVSSKSHRCRSFLSFRV